MNAPSSGSLLHLVSELGGGVVTAAESVLVAEQNAKTAVAQAQAQSQMATAQQFLASQQFNMLVIAGGALMALWVLNR